MATIVENLNKMIENNGGDQQGHTIAECINILDEVLSDKSNT